MKKLAFALLMTIAAPVYAQSTPHFAAAFTAFTRICTETAPSFRAAERAARPFGIRDFRFRPEVEDSTQIGMYHGYSYEVPDEMVGYSTPRQVGDMAISYTTNYPQIDHMCVLTFLEADGLSTEQTRDLFLRSVEHQFSDRNPEGRHNGTVQVIMREFDYEFSATLFEGIVYLYLHVWD